jgi:hypothetical protein
MGGATGFSADEETPKDQMTSGDRPGQYQPHLGDKGTGN